MELLAAATPYEGTYPIVPYTRGYAYLRAGKGTEAAQEFQRLVDRRTLVVNNAYMIQLAKLGLARAYSQQGDKAKARTAYQDFFAAWKDADPSIPILLQAKAEYAKLN